jgi:hypothetical protein
MSANHPNLFHSHWSIVDDWHLSALLFAAMAVPSTRAPALPLDEMCEYLSHNCLSCVMLVDEMQIWNSGNFDGDQIDSSLFAGRS